MMSVATSKRKHNIGKNKPKNKSKVRTTKLGPTISQKEVYIKSKIRRLNDALECDPVDIELLRKLMISPEGCVTNDIRCKVWPKLLNINVFSYPKKKNAEIEKKDFQGNTWWHQVNLDVNRSHRRFPHDIRLSRKKVLQHQLTNIIMRVLCRNPGLHYYQGYHDIAVTLLRVLDEDLATTLLDQLSNTHLRDFMDKNMNRTNKMLSFFYAILAKEDEELHQFLIQSEVGTIFALSWLITWFGHDINGFDLIVRLYDLFLASHPLMPMYVAVSLVISHKSQVLERECEMPMVHTCLCRLPKYIGVDEIELLVSNAYNLYKKHPPESLKKDVKRYIKESDSISQHAELLYQSYNQRPDSILRRRKKLGRFFLDAKHDAGELVDNESEETRKEVKSVAIRQINPVMKVAVWTVTVSMGVMTFLVLNSPKYWL